MRSIRSTSHILLTKIGVAAVAVVYFVLTVEYLASHHSNLTIIVVLTAAWSLLITGVLLLHR
jgi:hypothetical protein